VWTNYEGFVRITDMNPCLCGYAGDETQTCTCSNALVSKYQKRISGPILDRIDIHLEVPRVPIAKVQRFCALDEAGRQLLRNAAAQMNLSARAYHRILKLTRTIADLAGEEAIRRLDLAEALQYRPRGGM
jgi:magnesium chelatase family protein